MEELRKANAFTPEELSLQNQVEQKNKNPFLDDTLEDSFDRMCL